MSESTQKKLLRVRPPRVRITYDVHTNGAIEKRELPFIVGIFADLSGDRDPNASPLVPPDMKDRKIVDIDRDNFNEVLKQSGPRVVLKNVDNVLPGGSGKLSGRVIMFESLSDFEPINVVRKVDVLEYAELGMEAIWKIEVEDFPAFIIVDDKGNDFYADVTAAASMPVFSILVMKVFIVRLDSTLASALTSSSKMIRSISARLV
jgi:type VI secretion system ImpB/VipA family protein